MELIKTHEFDYENQKYAIKVLSDGDTIEVQTSLQGDPENGKPHSVTYPARLGTMNAFGKNIVDYLVQRAESNVKTKKPEDNGENSLKE